MTVEVAVLYANLAVVRVRWEDKRTLQLDEVIAVSVVSRKYHKRLLAEIEHDYYLLIWTDTEVCLSGHDDDYLFCSLDGPGYRWRFPFDLPLHSIEFKGATIDAVEYEKAKAIFGDPQGPMY